MILLILTVLLLIVGCIQQPQQVVVVEEKDYETFDDVDKNGEEYESFLLHINSNQLDNIFLLGAVDDGKQYLSIADLYLSSSLSEGLPYSLLEAMSFGVPIVATNVEGHIDLIEDNITGLLYEVGDIDSAVAKIQKLLDDDNLYHEISMNQRYELSNEYSIDKMTKNIVSIYNKIMCLEV